MKRFNVLVTFSAHEDVIGVINYLSNTLQNKKAAKEYHELFLDSLKSPEYMPCRNPISKLDFLYESELRLINIGSYVAVYKVFQEDSTVKVYRVLYEKADLSRIFGEIQEGV